MLTRCILVDDVTFCCELRKSGLKLTIGLNGGLKFQNVFLWKIKVLMNLVKTLLNNITLDP